MRGLDPRVWMLIEAVELFEAADRLQRQFFRIGRIAEAPCWEPPVDMFEDGDELCLMVALPGVAPDRFEVVLEQSNLIVRGQRLQGSEPESGEILRLEIPYGRFERRVSLPYARYQLAGTHLEHGCLRIKLERIK
jgi:HSP20 family protein